MLSKFSLALVLLNPVICFLIHIVLARLILEKRMPKQKLAFFCCIAGSSFTTCLSVVAEIFFFDNAEAPFFFLAMGSLLLCHIYFHIFNMSETARRIKILVDIKLGRETLSDLSIENMIGVRILRLLELKQMQFRDGHYHLHPTFLLWIAKGIYLYEGLLFPERKRESLTPHLEIGLPAES